MMPSARGLGDYMNSECQQCHIACSTSNVTYRSPSWMVWSVVFPFSFCSRLIRPAAAPRPITTAKMWSATLEMI